MPTHYNETRNTLFYVVLLVSTHVLSAQAQASASTSGDQTICAGQSTAGLGGTVGNGATAGVWTSSGTGAFAPDDTTLNATYTPSAADESAGTVTLTLTTTDQPEGVQPGTAEVVVTISPVLQAPVALESRSSDMTDTGLYLCWTAVPGADGYCVDVFDPGLAFGILPFTAEILNWDVGSVTNEFDFDAGPGLPPYFFRVRAYSTNTCDMRRHYGPSSNFALAYNTNAPETEFHYWPHTWTNLVTWWEGTNGPNVGTLWHFKHTADLASVTDISLANQGITRVTFGTQLPALQRIDLSGNLLTNLYCTGVPFGIYALTSLNVANNPYLLSVDCFNNSLTELDLTGDTNLQRLNAFSNPGLTNIDVSTCTSLTIVDICGDQLATFDTSQNPKLTLLSAADIPFVSLDFAANTDLLSLNVRSELITNLDLSNNPKLQLLLLGCPNLADLTMSSTELVVLDLSSCPAGVLPTLTSLPNLMFLGVPPGTSDLDISQNPLLFGLNCSGCSLSSLVVTNYPCLIYLDCSSNPLPSLDVSQNPALIHLNCAGCYLTSLDISSNTNLNYLNCFNNSLELSAIDATLANLYNFAFNYERGFGFLDLSGGSNQAPDSTGLWYVNALLASGKWWHVFVNP